MRRRSHTLLVFLFGLAGHAAAKPHVFAVLEVEFDIDSTRLSSLRIGWTYDEITTLVLFDTFGLDADEHGALKSDVWPGTRQARRNGRTVTMATCISKPTSDRSRLSGRCCISRST